MRDWEKRLYTTSGGSRNDRDISVVPLNNHFSGAGAMIVHPKEEALLGILGSELALNARGTPAVFCTNKIAAARLKEVIRQSALDNKGDIKVLTLNDAKKLKPGVPDKLEVGPLIIYSLDQESHGGVHRSSLAPFERQRILTPQVIH
ncbi:MAG: hypothetical protein KDA68_23220, partial [Planctomycetaceae bacterium]|nr:hypothetical protein [Planctomycetaceae bacterium]